MYLLHNVSIQPLSFYDGYTQHNLDNNQYLSILRLSSRPKVINYCKQYCQSLWGDFIDFPIHVLTIHCVHHVPGM